MYNTKVSDIKFNQELVNKIKIMARNAEKKAAENAAYWSNILQVLLAVVTVSYVMKLLWVIRSSEEGEWTYMMFIWPIIYFFCERTTYNMLIDELTRGLKPNYSLDLFAVITFSHFVSIFSETFGTYILYTVPLYIVYKLGGYLMSYLKMKSN